MLNSEITVYTLPSCQPCRAVKRFLTQKSVRFREVDVSQSEEAMSHVRQLGYNQTPVVEAGSEHWYGFDPSRMEALVS